MHANEVDVLDGNLLTLGDLVDEHLIATLARHDRVANGDAVVSLLLVEVGYGLDVALHQRRPHERPFGDGEFLLDVLPVDVLVALEAVLGLDNLLYIAIESGRVESTERTRVQRIGS